MDFAYEIVLSVEIIEKCEEETAGLLFDIPLAHFRDLHIPLMMLASNKGPCSQTVHIYGKFIQ